MNILMSISPIRDTGHNTKQREVIFNWMGFEMLSCHDDNSNNDDDDCDEEDKNDDDDDDND